MLRITCSMAAAGIKICPRPLITVIRITLRSIRSCRAMRESDRLRLRGLKRLTYAKLKMSSNLHRLHRSSFMTRLQHLLLPCNRNLKKWHRIIIILPQLRTLTNKSMKLGTINSETNGWWQAWKVCLGFQTVIDNSRRVRIRDKRWSMPMSKDG